MPIIALNQWKERAPLPRPRAGCAVGTVSGKILVAGGTEWREGKKFWCSDVSCFDPATNRWSPVTPMPQPHGDAPAAVLDKTLYVFGGGADGLPVNSVLTYQDSQWSVRLEMALPAPRRSSAVAVLDETFYLFGGLAGSWTDYGSVASTFWAYDPKCGWESLPYLPGVTRFNTAISSIGGRIIVAGGCSATGGQVQNLDEIFSYDPRMRTWSIIGQLPVPSRGAVGLAAGDRFLYFGGYTDKFETAIWSINPTTGRVDVAGQLPCGLADARFVSLETSIFGVSGENGIKMRFPGTIEALRR